MIYWGCTNPRPRLLFFRAFIWPIERLKGEIKHGGKIVGCVFGNRPRRKLTIRLMNEIRDQGGWGEKLVRNGKRSFPGDEQLGDADRNVRG